MKAIKNGREDPRQTEARNPAAENLPGPHLANNLLNLGVWEQSRQAVEELGCNLDFLRQQEEEPGLGNGGLGRLASCFMDSLASLEVPAVGYGLRYEFGIFDQAIRDGWQVQPVPVEQDQSDSGPAVTA